MNQILQSGLGPRPLEPLKQLLGSRRALLAIVFLILAGLWLAAQAQGIPPERLLSLTVRGVMLGGILALGAIGLSLIFGVLRIGNYAHGDLMTSGAYLALLFISFLPIGSPLAPFSFGYEFLLALVLAMPLVGLLGYSLDRLIFRQLRAQKSQPVILAMASLGSAFLLRSLIYLFWGADFLFYYTGRARPAIELFAGIRVRPDQLFILGLVVVLVILIYLLLEKTRMGKAMRATADNAELARISGINTEQVVLWTWLIGGALAGASGVMYGLDTQLRPEMGWFLLLPLFASVILGGIGNPYGALAGALVIAVAWQVSTAFLNPAYGPGIAFVVMILVLLIRPQGLFGKA